MEDIPDVNNYATKDDIQYIKDVINEKIQLDTYDDVPVYTNNGTYSAYVYGEYIYGGPKATLKSYTAQFGRSVTSIKCTASVSASSFSSSYATCTITLQLSDGTEIGEQVLKQTTTTSGTITGIVAFSTSSTSATIQAIAGAANGQSGQGSCTAKISSLKVYLPDVIFS